MRLKYIAILLLVFGYFSVYSQTSPVKRAMKVDTLTTLYLLDGDTTTTTKATE